MQAGAVKSRVEFCSGGMFHGRTQEFCCSISVDIRIYRSWISAMMVVKDRGDAD
jgi:hypothetical protein